jgi:hypothetical protein
MLPKIYLGTCIIVCIALAAALEDFRFPTFYPDEHNTVYCDELPGLETSGKASINFLNRYIRFYGCPPVSYSDLNLDGYPDQAYRARNAAIAAGEEIVAKDWFPSTPAYLPNGCRQPGEEQEQTGTDDMAGKQNCIGQLDVNHLKTVVDRLVTKLTALEQVVAEIKEDTKFSQAGAAVAAVSLVLALLYVAVVCFVAARNLGNARQQKLKREEQEKLDQAAERAARRLRKRSGSKDRTREPLL